MIRLDKLIAPAFYSVHRDVRAGRHTHYWLGGGRGSTKSSFVSLEIILGMMADPQANGMALRKVGVNLKDSVFEQLLWAVEALGVGQFWQAKLSPLELVYIPTGQKLLFRGADEPRKIKSTKFRRGYCKFLWYEEVDEFGGMEEIRNINQSLMRGGDRFLRFIRLTRRKASGAGSTRKCWRNGRISWCITAHTSACRRNGWGNSLSWRQSI